MRRGPVSSNSMLEKKKKVCVLGKGCGHLASASDLILGLFGARGGASRGRVLPAPPFDPKSRDIPPFDHFNCSLGHVGAPPAAVFFLYSRLTPKTGGVPPNKS